MVEIKPTNLLILVEITPKRYLGQKYPFHHQQNIRGIEEKRKRGEKGKVNCGKKKEEKFDHKRERNSISSSDIREKRKARPPLLEKISLIDFIWDWVRMW
ncbi:hypothetical protein ACOSP7_026489 [Xanthoceras sorbifolium]